MQRLAPSRGLNWVWAVIAAGLSASAGCTCQGERDLEPAVSDLGAAGSSEVQDQSAAPRQLYLPDAGRATWSVDPTRLPPVSRRCPSDMVDVAGEFCIDRHEASFIDHDAERPLSPFFHPTPARTKTSYDYWRGQPTSHAALLAGPSLREPRVPTPPDWQLHQAFRPRAISKPGVRPQGYLNGVLARMACENAGKRLCREEEWVRACRGERDLAYPYGDTYEAGACNVARDNHPAAILHGNASTGHLDPRLNLVEDRAGPLLRPTGSSRRCASRWGDDAIMDMVGNLDEWIDDETGVFLGGFYARQTESGCASRIGAHAFEYFDYSLGVRCCA